MESPHRKCSSLLAALDEAGTSHILLTLICVSGARVAATSKLFTRSPHRTATPQEDNSDLPAFEVRGMICAAARNAGMQPIVVKKSPYSKTFAHLSHSFNCPFDALSIWHLPRPTRPLPNGGPRDHALYTLHYNLQMPIHLPLLPRHRSPRQSRLHKRHCHHSHDHASHAR